MLVTASCAVPTANSTVEPASSPEVVVFSDTVLEAKVRAAMNKPEGDIIAAEAEEVKSLDLSNEFQPDMPDDIVIKNASGLEYFSNLVELNLGFNNIADLTPLSQLQKLESLYVYSNNSVSDISPLGNLTNLSVLNLQYNQIKDISPLAGLENLTVLLLKGNAVTDYSPLKDLFPNLMEKDFEIISIDNVSDEPIVFADPNLESTVRRVLGIQGRPVTQKDAFQVQSLNLGHSIPSDEAFIDLTGLEHFVNLEELSLDGNKISDLSPISGLVKMKSLVIAFNEITDLGALSGMTQLEVLDAKNNRISDVSPLAVLTDIWELQLNANQITDVSPLASLKNLKALLLAGNPVTDFNSLTDIYPQLDNPDFKLK
ncbi:MAG TPA: leucine-rich repeat domain-containing protein [Clostridia bacterium]|nr:leucine-rich repeat domain-containing protein [Clostridia bacterium]